jgi:kynurenine/2-aminoadipate aminotransferase
MSSHSIITNYERFLSKVSKKRQPSAIRALMPLMRLPGMISLAGGLPNSDSFPFDSCTFRMKDGSTLELNRHDMELALQYSPSEGIPLFHNWLLEHQKMRHRIDGLHHEYGVVVTTGSQDALTKCFEMMLDTSDSDDPMRDAVLVENPSYSGALAALVPMGCELIEVPLDSEGIIPERMEEILLERKKLSETKKMGKIKFLYTIPTGQNPSGATLTNERKRKIYELARRFDFLIMEDDPYYYLTLDDNSNCNESFLSMDTDGRVIRFDSLSKLLSSGMRIGWCTGPKDLISRIHLHMQASCLHASGVSQMMAYNLFTKWGIEGLDTHVQFVQNLYRKKRDEFIESVETHLKGYITYYPPSAGMFIWMKLNGVSDTKQFIEQKAREKKILLVPGQAFSPNNKPSPYVRASFSIVSKQDMDIACARLKELLVEYLGTQKN